MVSTIKNRWRSSFTTEQFAGRCVQLEHLEPREMLAGDVPTTEVLAFTIRATDLSGNEIQQVAAGQSFTIEVYAQDRRGQEGVTVPSGSGYSNLPRGLSQAFLNISFAHQGFNYDHTRSVTPGPYVDPLPGALNPDVSIDGMIYDVGLYDMGAIYDALSGILHPDPLHIFSVPMVAETPGNYQGAKGIVPHFDFMRQNQPNSYDAYGVPVLLNYSGQGVGQGTELILYGNQKITDPNLVFFSGADLTVIPAGQMLGDFQLRVVKTPTSVVQGEVVNLPNSASFIDEWDTVYVEIYGKAPNGQGLQNAVVNINFNANQFKFHDVIANQQDSNLRYSLTSVDSTSVAGRVTVSLSNPLGNTGDDNYALLGRVRLMSIMELANDTSNGYIQPTTSQAISIGTVTPTFQVLGGSTSTIGNALAFGSSSFSVWPVMYDADDNGRVGLSDFTQFISAYGKPATTPQGYKFDFDKNGTVGLSDFLLFIQNYGQQRGQVNTRTYHSSFPNSFLEGEPMMLEGEPMMGGDSLLEGEPYFYSATTTSLEPVNESFNLDASPMVATSASTSPLVVQYIADTYTSESSVNFDLSSNSDLQTETFWELAEDPATIEIGDESDELLQSVAVPPRADTINQETDELFEDFDESLTLDW